MADITELTRNPVTALQQDELSETDYREIFTELREQWSLDQFVKRVGSQYSKAQWSKWQRGETALTPQMRNDLRRGVGLNQLPPSVAHTLSRVDADGAVYQMGTAAPNAALVWNESEMPNVIASVSRNQVTRLVAPRKGIEAYDVSIWGLDAIPGRILAHSIRNREEIEL